MRTHNDFLTHLALRLCHRVIGIFGIFSLVLLCALTSPRAHAQDMAIDGINRAGLAMLAKMDEDQTGDLWDAGSPLLQKLVTRDAFIELAAQLRRPPRAVRSRTWSAFTQATVEVAQPNTPAGRYISMRYLTTFEDGSVFDELLTIRLETDAWRIVGYVPTRRR